MPRLAATAPAVDDPKQQIELIRRERLARKLRDAPSDDPVAFAAAVGFVPDEWQREVLATQENCLLNIARQCGKSSVVALKALHKAIYTPNSMILLVSPSDRQSGELFKKVQDFYKALPPRSAPRLTECTKRALTLENGSRIISLPNSEDKIRGISAVNLLIFDESGDVPENLVVACRPMRATTNGQIICAGTPKGKRGWFWNSWSSVSEKWRRFEVKASEIKRISREFLADERVSMGAAYAQEYECAWLAGVFGRVYGAFDPDRNLTVFTPGFECEHYVLGIDYGFNDDCAFTVLGWNTHDPAVYCFASYRKANMTPSDAALEVKRLSVTYRFNQMVGDTGGLGKGYAEEARRRFTLPIIPAEKNNKRGYIDLLNGNLSRGLLKLNRVSTGELVEEWQNLPWDDKRQKEAEGFPNHCADATLYAWRACTNYHEAPQLPPPEVGSKEYYAAQEAKIVADIEARLLNDSNQRADWWNCGLTS